MANTLVVKFAQDFEAFVAAHRKDAVYSDSRRKEPRNTKTPKMIRRYRKGRKVQVMA